MSGTAEPAASFLAHVVLRALDVAPRTVDDIAREARLLPATIDAVLAELRAAGRAIEVEPGRWQVMR
jgi:predicted Rossmann fold nucleotide-binding protein DprA/Smf involved in DNA uptake